METSNQQVLPSIHQLFEREIIERKSIFLTRKNVDMRKTKSKKTSSKFICGKGCLECFQNLVQLREHLITVHFMEISIQQDKITIDLTD